MRRRSAVRCGTDDGINLISTVQDPQEIFYAGFRILMIFIKYLYRSASEFFILTAPSVFLFLEPTV
jgi:hypothetical protein